MEDDIDKCKTIDNLKPTDTIITATDNTNQNDNHIPAIANEWTETIENIARALARAEDLPEAKRESFTKALKYLLGHIEELQKNETSE